jgi:hypothetical protein
VSEAELARRLGKSPQSFNSKMKRGSFSIPELEQIADVLGVSFKREFIMAKQAKAKKAVEKKVGDSKRAGYKRGSNSRINQTVEKIMRRARAVLRDDASRFGKQKA